MNELALFAGGGGMLPGKLLGWRTVCYVEREPYAVEIIKARIRDGMLDDAPIWDDASTFDGYPWTGYVDIVTAGFPCQPWSIAGKQLGADDERNLWPDTIRVIREVRPRWVLLENVANLLSRLYIQQIFGDLAESGFDARWDCILAAAVGAPHIRDRVWIIAHANGRQQGWRQQSERETHQRNANLAGNGTKGDAADAEHNKVLLDQHHDKTDKNFTRSSWWASESGVCGVAYGVAARMDRLKALGNGQVPAVARAAWNMLRGKEQ